MEGIALQWLMECADIKNTTIACNSPVAGNELRELLRVRYGHSKEVLYMPNYYRVDRGLLNDAVEFRRGADLIAEQRGRVGDRLTNGLDLGGERSVAAPHSERVDEPAVFEMDFRSIHAEVLVEVERERRVPRY